MNNAKTSALGRKLGKVKDYFTGTTRVDNKNNPDSAYSRAMLKSKMTLPRSKQPKTLNVY